MNWIGPQIEALRKKRGLRRDELAGRLSVSIQTVYNFERRPDYDASLGLLRAMEEALGARIELSIKEVRVNSSADPTITMGNDEFILLIRKQYPKCSLDNAVIGKRIWEWLRDRNGQKVAEDFPALWAGADEHLLDESGLPKTAAQFSFPLGLLPEIYAFLAHLGAS